MDCFLQIPNIYDKEGISIEKYTPLFNITKYSVVIRGFGRSTDNCSLHCSQRILCNGDFSR